MEKRSKVGMGARARAGVRGHRPASNWGPHRAASLQRHAGTTPVAGPWRAGSMHAAEGAAARADGRPIACAEGARARCGSQPPKLSHGRASGPQQPPWLPAGTSSWICAAQPATLSALAAAIPRRRSGTRREPERFCGPQCSHVGRWRTFGSSTPSPTMLETGSWICLAASRATCARTSAGLRAVCRLAPRCDGILWVTARNRGPSQLLRALTEMTSGPYPVITARWAAASMCGCAVAELRHRLRGRLGGGPRAL